MQSTRTVPNNANAPGSGTEDTLPSTLYNTLEATANVWSRVNEYGATDPVPPVTVPWFVVVNGPTVPIRLVSAKRALELEKYALSAVLPVPPVIVAEYAVTNDGFAGLKLISLNLTSSAVVAPASLAVSEVRSSPAGTSLGEKLVPLMMLTLQPPIVPAIVSVPAARFMSLESVAQPVPTQVPLSPMVAVNPPADN